MTAYSYNQTHGGIETITRPIVTTRRQRDGVSTTYAYDALDRLTTVSLPGGGNNADRSYAYDLHGNIIIAATARPGYSAQTNFVYDAFGQKTVEASLLNGGATKTKVSYYNPAGQRTRLDLPESGLYFTYEYDGPGQMTAIREQGAGLAATFAYDDLGRRTQKAYPNGTSQSYGFDTASRLASVSLTAGAQTGTIQLERYNPAGQIGLRTISNNSYAWAGGTPVNRPYTVNGLNQYINIAGGAIGYDLRGNLTASGSASFGYDAYNQLTSYQGTAGGATKELLYDGLGRLVYASDEGIRFDYDGDRLIGEYDGSGNLLRRYLHGPGADEPLIWYPDTTIQNKRYLDADERGSIVRVTDGGGGIVATNTYDPYGIPGTGNVGRFQYTGQAWLPQLGMYHYKARIYSPTLGRFMQTDPIGYGDGLNWYDYVGGDPVNHTDPSGLASDISTGTNIPGQGCPYCFGTFQIAGERRQEKRDGKPLSDGRYIVPYSTLDGGPRNYMWALAVRIGDLASSGLSLGYSGGAGTQNINDGSILESRRKGERGRAATNQGTPDPYKHMKPAPGKPGFGQVKDPQTGKLSGPKPWPTDPRLGPDGDTSKFSLLPGGAVVLGGGALVCAIVEPCGAAVAAGLGLAGLGLLGW